MASPHRCRHKQLTSCDRRRCLGWWGLGTTSVAAFDHDGTERWRHTLGEYASTPAVTGETVVYGAGTPQVVSYDAVSGERLWQFDTDGETTAAPTIADNRVVVGTQAGTLYSLDLQDGSKDSVLHKAA